LLLEEDSAAVVAGAGAEVNVQSPWGHDRLGVLDDNDGRAGRRYSTSARWKAVAVPAVRADLVAKVKAVGRGLP
jgi:hypothetical protein